MVNDYTKGEYNHTPKEMIGMLKTYLGEVARAFWESFKREFPEKVTVLYADDNNPINFVNTIAQLLTGEDPTAARSNTKVNA